MDRSPVPAWTGAFVGAMHEKRVTCADLAKEAHVSTAYVSMILSGSRTPSNGKDMLEEAFQNILEKRNKEENSQ